MLFNSLRFFLISKLDAFQIIHLKVIHIDDLLNILLIWLGRDLFLIFWLFDRFLRLRFILAGATWEVSFENSNLVIAIHDSQAFGPIIVLHTDCWFLQFDLIKAREAVRVY